MLAKRAGTPTVTTAAKDKHLLIESERYKRKTAPELPVDVIYHDSN